MRLIGSDNVCVKSEKKTKESRLSITYPKFEDCDNDPSIEEFGDSSIVDIWALQNVRQLTLNSLIPQNWILSILYIRIVNCRFFVKEILFIEKEILFIFVLVPQTATPFEATQTIVKYSCNHILQINNTLKTSELYTKSLGKIFLASRGILLYPQKNCYKVFHSMWFYLWVSGAFRVG